MLGWVALNNKDDFGLERDGFLRQQALPMMLGGGMGAGMGGGMGGPMGGLGMNLLSQQLMGKQGGGMPFGQQQQPGLGMLMSLFGGGR